MGCFAVDWEGRGRASGRLRVRTGDGGLRAAVDEWTDALGADGVSDDPAVLPRYSRTTQAEAPSPGCVLWPTTTE
ncbi:MAG: hypothetical protein QGG73_02760 [Candidatus Hydrogenedentes bacterium]|nr:hypothetical protein [Candidatus Hydrogenedentota bacterium]